MARTASRPTRRLRNGGVYLLPDGARVTATRLGEGWLLVGPGGAEYRLDDAGAILRARWPLPPGATAPLLQLSPTEWWRTDLRPLPDD